MTDCEVRLINYPSSMTDEQRDHDRSVKPGILIFISRSSKKKEKTYDISAGIENECHNK